MIELMTTKELVAMLKISRSSINKIIKEEGFPKPVIIGQRKKYWRVNDINAWLSAR